MASSKLFSDILTANNLLILSIIISSLLITDIHGQTNKRVAVGDAKKSQPKSSSSFKSSCGDEMQVADKAGKCLEPIYELLEGRVLLPTNDVGLQNACDRFNATEKCVRNVARDCLQGVHKTAMSSVASATRRFRLQECKTAASRAKYTEPISCINKYNKEMQAMLRNHTAIAQGIRDMKKSPEERLVAACCLLDAMDRNMALKFEPICSKSLPLMLGMVHSITDDARNTLCLRPKCNGVLNSVLKTPYQPGQDIIEPIMQVVFAI